MGSLVAEVAKKKAMWLHPKVLGFNPSERWGHSACFFKGLMYVFGWDDYVFGLPSSFCLLNIAIFTFSFFCVSKHALKNKQCFHVLGCCGGLHFSDVLTLDLDKIVWSKLATTGEKPGPRDSHSAVLVGRKMIVFGGTNGFKKVNHIHILDLVTKEWIRPECKGIPPSPRESHTATLVGERLVIFGGSGDGDANYLNDLHILDLRTMRWTSPELKGDFPVPRDSHSTLAIGNKLIVYGGDSSDQYHGNVYMLDMETMTWSRLAIQGSSPGVRAGHAAVTIGTKVYVIGGVGDKRYYNDIWIFDICTCSWNQLDIGGQQPQGRFSHTAVVADMDIAIYGGCGEDERPINELLVLQLGAEHPNGRYNISMCKVFGTYWNQDKKTIPEGADTISKTILMGNDVEVLGKVACEVVSEKAQPCHFDSGTSRRKRRRIAAVKIWDVESEQEVHSLSLSERSSPSQSGQEQTPGQKVNACVMDSQQYLMLKRVNQIPTNCQHDNGSRNERVLKNIPQKRPQNLCFLEHQPKQEQRLHGHEDRKGARHQASDHKSVGRGPIQHLIGAEVLGRVDGAFDSGLLMTAAVNGRIFRGVLFAPQGAGAISRGASVEPNCCLTSSFPSTQQLMKSNHVDNLRVSQQVATCSRAESCHGSREAPVASLLPNMRGTPSLSKEHKIRSDLQGLVLTLGGPASGNPQLNY